jgi:hypothetical protein
MRIPTDTALWLQKRLLGLDHEDWGLVYMLSGNLAPIPPDTPARLQLGVDLICRGLACDLIAVNDYGAFPDRPSFLEGIRTLDPDDVTAIDDMSGAGFWHGTLIWGTQRLSDLINANFPPPDERDDQLNPAFIEAVEQIFAENGVPWSDKPLLPILSDRAGTGASGTTR